VSTDSTATDRLTAYGKASLVASKSCGLFLTQVGVVACSSKLAPCPAAFLIILRPGLFDAHLQNWEAVPVKSPSHTHTYIFNISHFSETASDKMNYAPVGDNEEFTTEQSRDTDRFSRCIRSLDCTTGGVFFYEALASCFAGIWGGIVYAVEGCGDCFSGCCSTCGDCMGDCCQNCCS
jgi:hypothetical protein